MRLTIKPGTPVLVRYKDHVFYRNSDASQQTPRVLEAVGLLDYQDGEFVRLIWEQYSDPSSTVPSKVLSSGLVILRSTIVEIREASRPRSTSRKRLA